MPGMINKLIRYIWAFPCTCIGIVLLLFALPGGRIQLHSGIIEAWGPLFRAFRAVPWLRDTVAITLGHVVLGRDEEWIIWSRPHERVHVRQYEVWGILFFPAYLLSSFRVLLMGGHPYLENRFERSARAEAALEPLVDGRPNRAV
ncbi:MAG: hypothetical protein OQK67_00615 [Chlorobium sp.]|nr:hypothetical protein [Chlorobium sp.]MCW8820098.1 hypothetical protein [Ignavibacteriaceae bacterium]